jgi:YVTN family beta-propeller protein
MLRKVVVGSAVLLGLWGCSQNTASYSRSSGSLALSRDGNHIYAVDTDNNSVIVANAADGSKLQTIAVGKDPVRIVVGKDDRIYVSNRGERTVSVIDPKSLSEVTRLPVDVEPNGLSFTTDGKTLLVVSATDTNDPQQGTLTAIDTGTLKTQWKTQVGEEPRGIAVVGNNAYITNLKQGRTTVVDLNKQQVMTSVDLNNDDSPDPKVNPQARTAGVVTDVTPAPDGTRVYATHRWQLAAAIGAGGIVTQPTTPAPEASDSYGAAPQQPGCNNGSSIVSAGVGTIDTSSNTAKKDSFSNCTVPVDSDGNPTVVKDFPTTLVPSDGNHILQGPVTAVVEPTGNWLFVVNQNSQNVMVMNTHKRMTNDRPIVVDGVGAGADGIALSNDGRTAFVYAQFDHSLAIIRATGDDPDTLSVVNKVQLASDTLPADVVAGRNLFNSALNPHVTASNVGIACASCHPGGREDGHVWLFPDGSRQTPSLAGRALDRTAPYHWAGIFPQLEDFFTETIVSRMGGTGLNNTENAQLKSFLFSLKAPENPLQNRPDLADKLARGQAAFAKAGCEQCHTSSNSLYTNNSDHNVGTIGPSDLLEVISNGVGTDPSTWQPLQAINTPSLLGLGRTAPYLHDGSILTIRARIDQSRSPKHDGLDHGDTSVLNDQEISDLETYLLSL